MNHHRWTRRRFLQHASAAAAAAAVPTAVPYWYSTKPSVAATFQAKNDRPQVGAIGVGGRGLGITSQAARFGDIVAVCDADMKRAEAAKARFGGRPDAYQDYRKVLERDDIDVVVNGTPDHWHTIINIAACKAGKDVYTEKPLTLTIDEGKILCRVVKETGRIVQVGTQQRSVPHFRLACELVRNGRIGSLRSVTVMLPFWNTKGGPFLPQPVPPHLDWDLYQGQAPEQGYHPMRTHFNFRWWFEYAGGIITDWGQHHMDIAHWGMDMEHGGPLEIEAKGFFPNKGQAHCFNNPDRFVARMKYPGDVDLLYLVVRDDKYLASMKAGDISEAEDAELFAGLSDAIKGEKRNGIMFAGDEGRIFVNRGGAFGEAVDGHDPNNLPSEWTRLPESTDHMGNFFHCVQTRETPISPAAIGHRTITACHLGNIAIRLKRRIRWDPEKEQILGYEEANAWQKREQREPYLVRG
jgi:predicted dehydrogenase